MAEEKIKTTEIKLETFFDQMLSIIGKITDQQIADILVHDNLTIAVAESLTGGMISSRLSSPPGASEYFIGSVVCYHNRIKIMEANVPPAVISKFGPVSRETAIAMAEGIRQRFKTNLGLSATGAAGPDPLLRAQPGTVFIACANEKGTQAKELHLNGSRSEIRENAAQTALGFLWLNLGGKIN